MLSTRVNQTFEPSAVVIGQAWAARL